MTDQPEFYPMPSFPTLTVRDLDVSSRWYQDVLGFSSVFAMPFIVHLRWAKYADLLLRPGPATAEKKGAGITLSYAVTGAGFDALDALAERARARGAVFLQEPGDRPWNARDFTIADPDGFALTFTMGPLKANLSINEVMGTAKSP